MDLDFRTVADDLLARTPDRVALIDAGGEWTFAELRVAVLAATARLRAAGVAPGQRVVIIDAPSRLALVAVFAVMRLAATATMIDPRLAVDEVTAMASSVGPGPVAVAPTAYADRLAGIEVDVLGAELLDPFIGDDAPAPASDADADAVLLFTSGTTGLPKPVPLPGPALVARVAAYVDPPAPQVRMLCVPTHHVGGLIGAIVAVIGGHTLVLQPKFDAGEWLRLVEAHRVETLFIVPTMLSRIVGHPSFPDRDLSSLKLITYGASPMTADLVDKLTEALPGVGLVNTFGQTETTGGITLSTPQDALHPVRRTSVGRAVPGVQLKVVAPGSEDELPVGAVGELLVLAPQNVVPGWLRTGDLVRIDEDGYVYPAGRRADTINRGGEKFGPMEVETVLRAHPHVVDCAVAGVPDPELHHRVGAVVVVREPVPPDDLRQWCAERIARFKTPELIAFVDEVPLTDMNKIDRKEVARLVAARATPSRPGLPGGPS